MSETAKMERAQTRETLPRAEDPIALFQEWFQDAIDSGLKEPRAMSVATVDADGSPDTRMLLLKDVDIRGFVFYTNLQSPKARSLTSNPRVALCFYWAQLDRQVRIRGRAERVSDTQADAYFATRPRLSQISAWASKQSQPMRGYFELEAQVVRKSLFFGIGSVPRPPFWSGFRVIPERIEFWTQKTFRRHARVVYTRGSNAWEREWLYP
jgi:pyridoxamine 5'-phosphate oxidase